MIANKMNWTMIHLSTVEPLYSVIHGPIEIVSTKLPQIIT